MNIVSKELAQTVLKQFILPSDGIHGLPHWARVFENGCRLAQLNQANLEIVQLFAIFHDAKRINEGRDFRHGHRGAEYAASLRGLLFDLSDKDFELLHTACTYHSKNLTEADITIQTCWDADRLDLGRVGIRPDPRYLCTAAAKKPEIIYWATKRARKQILPKWVYFKWGFRCLIL